MSSADEPPRMKLSAELIPVDHMPVTFQQAASGKCYVLMREQYRISVGCFRNLRRAVGACHIVLGSNARFPPFATPHSRSSRQPVGNGLRHDSTPERTPTLGQNASHFHYRRVVGTGYVSGRENFREPHTAPWHSHHTRPGGDTISGVHSARLLAAFPLHRPATN